MDKYNILKDPENDRDPERHPHATGRGSTEIRDARMSMTTALGSMAAIVKNNNTKAICADYNLPADATEQELNNARAAYMARAIRADYNLPADATEQQLNDARAAYMARGIKS